MWSGFGGVSFGLKIIAWDQIHIFFAGPTHSLYMLLGMMTGLYDGISIQDF
ncbi:hypothetical protein [Bacillus cereus]|uniref:hypothetical protein n=1 Tax=Bacillus cereus TaxID=1396 RepID=UPI000A79D6B1|nr:hypothetical protein [Bacillus cereus]MDA2480487.1 hypothetical protein [Bacillus cereus]